MKNARRKNQNQEVYLVFGTAFALYTALTIQLGGVTFDDIFNTLIGLFYNQPAYVSPNVTAIMVDIGLFVIGGLIFWLAFFSQFVLPVHSLSERKQVLGRLLERLGSGPGPAVFVKDGRAVEETQQRSRKGKGVIILDSASAAVLHNQSSYTRAVGPGLVFTEPGENIAGTIDLHTQFRRSGPKENREDPFDPQSDDESPEEYRSRQNRRLQTSALTRDGVEVVPNIEVTFRLEGKTNGGDKRFPYDHDAVWRAIAFEGIDPDAPADAGSRYVAWDWLPAHIAADLWREYLAKFTLNELFEYTSKPRSDSKLQQMQTGIEYIVSRINERMTQGLIAELDEVGDLTGRQVSSREYRFLKERGVQVLKAEITNLRMEKTVESKFVDRWKTTWLKRANEEKEFIDQRYSIERYKGQVHAQKEFGDLITRALAERLRNAIQARSDPPALTAGLELLIRSTLNGVVRNPELHAALTDEENQLVDLIEWLRKSEDDRSI